MKGIVILQQCAMKFDIVHHIYNSYYLFTKLYKPSQIWWGTLRKVYGTTDDTTTLRYTIKSWWFPCGLYFVLIDRNKKNIFFVDFNKVGYNS